MKSSPASRSRKPKADAQAGAEARREGLDRDEPRRNACNRHWHPKEKPPPVILTATGGFFNFQFASNRPPVSSAICPIVARPPVYFAICQNVARPSMRLAIRQIVSGPSVLSAFRQTWPVRRCFPPSVKRLRSVGAPRNSSNRLRPVDAFRHPTNRLRHVGAPRLQHPSPSRLCWQKSCKSTGILTQIR